MIQRVQLGNFSNYRLNSPKNKASNTMGTNSIKALNTVSFKRDGSYIYEETNSLINEVRDIAINSGQNVLYAKHDDGADIEFTLDKRGMDLFIEHIPDSFAKPLGLANLARMHVRNGAVTFYSRYPAFMLREMKEGEPDAVIQRYLAPFLED